MTPAPATRTAADGTTHGLLVRSGRPTSSAASGWLLRRSCPQAMFSRNGKRNRARGACTCFRALKIRAGQSRASGKHGGRRSTKRACHISRFTICVTYSARVSVGSLQMRGAAGNAAQQSGDQASLSTRNGGSGSRGHRTSQRASLPGPRVTTFFTTVRPNPRKRLKQ